MGRGSFGKVQAGVEDRVTSFTAAVYTIHLRLVIFKMQKESFLTIPISSENRKAWSIEKIVSVPSGRN